MARPSPRTFALAGVALATIGGLAARLVVLRSGLGTLDSDEAVVGLMARHFEHGHLQAFFAGQAYGGTIEAGFAAALFAVFGSSPLVLKCVPLFLDAGAAVLTWRIGLRLAAPRTAVLAGVLVWLWPATYLWWSIKERGFYEAGLCLTLLGALFAIRIAQHDEHPPWADWAALGFVAGLGWWQTPQIVYVLAPAAVWLVWHVRARAWQAIAAAPTFLLGAAPWIWPNVHDGFASLRPPPSPVKGTYVDHLVTLAHVGGPMTFGLRTPYTTLWLHPTRLSQLLYLMAIAVAVAGCARAWRGGRLVVVVLVVLPFVHALLPLAGTVAEGRYTLFALPWLALAIAHRASHRVGAAALVVVVIGVTVAGLASMRGQTDPYGPDRHVPRSLASLKEGLAAHQVRRLWANYWVAYRLTFETREQTIAAPASSDRFPQYASAVAADPAAAHVFMSGSHTDAVFHAALDSHHISYDRWTAGPDWVVYVPHARVGPTDFDNTYP